MMNVLVLIPTPLASPVVTIASASASAVVLNPAGVSNSDSSSVGLLPLPIPFTALNPVSSAFDDDFVLYTKYSPAAYWSFCHGRWGGRSCVLCVSCRLLPSLFDRLFLSSRPWSYFPPAYRYHASAVLFV
jgi:hypothetical protein